MFFQCANAIFRVPLELELILHVPEEPRKTSSPFHLDINSTHCHTHLSILPQIIWCQINREKFMGARRHGIFTRYLTSERS